MWSYTKEALVFVWLLAFGRGVDGYSSSSSSAFYSHNKKLQHPSSFGIVHPYSQSSLWSSSGSSQNTLRRHTQQYQQQQESDVETDVVDDHESKKNDIEQSLEEADQLEQQQQPSDAALYFLMTSGFGKLPNDVASQVQSVAMEREEMNRRKIVEKEKQDETKEYLQKEWQTRQKAQENAKLKKAQERAMLQKQYWVESLMKGVGKKGTNLYPEKKEREIQLEQPMEVIEEETKEEEAKQAEDEVVSTISTNEKEEQKEPSFASGTIVRDESIMEKEKADEGVAVGVEVVNEEDNGGDTSFKGKEADGEANALMEEEDTKRKAEEEAEAKLKAQKEEEEARLKAEEEAAKAKAEEEAKLRAEAEAAEAERAKREEEQELQRKKEIEEHIRLQKEKEEAEARELAVAEEEARKLEEQEEAMLNLQPLTDRATGVTFESKLGPGRYLMGVGVRKKAIINIYSVAMYSGTEVKKALEPLSRRKSKKDAYQTLREVARSTPTTFLLEMVFKTGAETMANAIAESVGSRFKGDAEEVDQLKKLIFDGVSSKGAATKGTTFEFDCTDDGLTVTVDGKTQGTVHSTSLSQAFCDIYLDDKTVSAQLRDSCLENCCSP